MKWIALFLAVALAPYVRAQNLPQRTLESLPAYEAFLSIPNDARKEGQLEPNLQWLEKEYGQRGFELQRLEGEGISMLLATYAAADTDAPTVLFYGHVDGQPVDPAKWKLAPPFQPTYGTMRSGPTGEIVYTPAARPTAATAIDPNLRLFVRSASDAKAPLMLFLVAWDEMIATRKRPNYHVKFIFDSMEEASRLDLAPMVASHRDALAADHLIILDGPVHPVNKPSLMGGARGIATARLTVYGPRLPLHSGHYGNYAPNPALRLAELLASMKNDAGKVTIPGFYDGIELTAADRKLLAAAPDDLGAIHAKLGFSVPEGVGRNLQEALQYPSLNVRGMSSGWVGSAARTIIPANAVANIDVRLVKESNGDRLLKLMEQHVKAQGYYLVPDGREPTDEERAEHSHLASFAGRTSYGAFRTDLNGPTGRWLQSAITASFGEGPVLVRTMGGSVPIAPFVNTLRVPAIVLPLVNPDNNQHSPNENIALTNYFMGAKVLYGVLTEPL